MKEELSNIIKQIINSLGYDTDNITIAKSNICDYQCNDLFKIAKIFNKNPIEIGNEIVNDINKLKDFDNYFKEVTFSKPGFINIRISDKLINKYLKMLYEDEKQLLDKTTKETYVIDYGGANVAKPLHVGHMRTAIVGESIKRIINYIYENKIVEELDLNVFNFNERAIHCYEKIGFVKDGIGITENDIHMKYKK